MSPYPTLPAQTALTDLEREFIENEPPGLFSLGQDSIWGQLRRVLTDKLQEVADLLATYYLNQSAKTVNLDDMREWEEMLGVPTNLNNTLEKRRSAILSSLVYGAFTRDHRKAIVESFIAVTFGTAVSLTPDGLALTSDGVQLFSDATSLTGTYNIVENIGNFSYDVRIRNDIAVDQTGLTRELTRLTPAGISFSISMVAVP